MSEGRASVFSFAFREAPIRIRECSDRHMPALRGESYGQAHSFEGTAFRASF